MYEIIDPQISPKNNIGENREEFPQNKEKEELQEINNSNLSSSTCSSVNDYKDIQGIKSSLLEKNEFDDIEDVKSQRKHSTPLETEKFFLNFSKMHDDIRGAYRNNLLLKGLLNFDQKESNFKKNTIFILDWDDTLLCTTVISPYGYFDDNMNLLPSKLKKIKHLETLVKKLLTKTTEKGDTYIITNSEPGWVEYSCKRFFPNVFSLLKKIKIISARGLYEKKYPNNFKFWKNMAFNDIIKNYDLNLPSNIICMGDSTYEMEAAHGLANKFPEGFIKAVKFKELPKIDELISQLNLILDKFDFIYSACKNWTITIDKKKKK